MSMIATRPRSSPPPLSRPDRDTRDEERVAGCLRTMRPNGTARPW